MILKQEWDFEARMGPEVADTSFGGVVKVNRGYSGALFGKPHKAGGIAPYGMGTGTNRTHFIQGNARVNQLIRIKTKYFRLQPTSYSLRPVESCSRYKLFCFSQLLREVHHGGLLKACRERALYCKHYWYARNRGGRLGLLSLQKAHMVSPQQRFDVW